MMLALRTTIAATPAEAAAAAALVAEPEAPISDAPVASPQGLPEALILGLLSPKTEPKDK